MPSLLPSKGTSAPYVTNIPEKWDREWFRSFVTHFLEPADTRNATASPSVQITSTLNTPATISTTANIDALRAEPFLVATTPDAVVTHWRLLAAQVGVLTTTDGGSLSNFTIGVANNGISNTLLAQVPGNTIKGNNTGGLANVSDLTPTQVTAMLNTFTSSLQGLVSASGGGTTHFLRADGSWATPAYPVSANPSAVVGLAAVNGTALTWMTSDSAPALSQAISPTWTGNHTFTPGSGNAIVVNGASGTFAVSVTGPASANQTFKVIGNFTGAGTTLASFTDVNNTNGVNIELVGNGATTPNKFIRVIGGVFQITNSAFTQTILNLTDAGILSIPSEFAINGGTPTAQLTGFGSPSGTPTSGLTSGATLAQTAGTLAALLAYLKTIGFIGA